MELANHSIQRFLDAQERDYPIALKEINDGHKNSHWIWYIFPQLKGLGHSYNSNYYGLIDVFEAIDYYNNPILRSRLIEITEALIHHKRKTVFDILPRVDVKKVLSCATLFEYVSHNQLFQEAIDIINLGEPDGKTIQLISKGIAEYVKKLFGHCRHINNLFYERYVYAAYEYLQDHRDLSAIDDLLISDRYLFGEFVVEGDEVYVMAYDLSTGPPDYVGIPISCIAWDKLKVIIENTEKLILNSVVSNEALLSVRVNTCERRRKSDIDVEIWLTASFYSGNECYAMVSNQNDYSNCTKETEFCYFFNGDSDGWMTFPDEITHLWEELRIDFEKIPQDITTIIIEYSVVSWNKDDIQIVIDANDRMHDLNLFKQEHRIKTTGSNLFSRRITVNRDNGNWFYSTINPLDK